MQSKSVTPGEALKYHVDYADVDPASVLGQIMTLIRPQSRVLELGCATGSMTRVLRNQLGCRIDAIELDAVAAEQARPYCERLLIADLETLDWQDAFFRDQTYDHVVIADVLEHLHDPGRVLAAVQAVLNKAGSIIISTPNIAYAGVQAALQAGWFPYRSTGLLDSGHVHFFTRPELEALILLHGLVPREQRAVRWGPEDSEFGSYWKSLDLPTRQQLLRATDANVYQWIVSAERATLELMRHYLTARFDGSLDGSPTRDQLAQLQAALEGARDHSRLLIDLLDAEVNRRKALESQAATWRGASELAERRLHDVLHSRSWRLTAPLRRATAWAQSLVRLRGPVKQRDAAATSHPGAEIRPSELLTEDWLRYREWLATHEALPADGPQRVAQKLRDTPAPPTIGIVMPVFNPNRAWLLEAIASVQRQWYPHWNLYIVDDASTAERELLIEVLESLAASDQRIHLKWRQSNGHIAAATNDGLGIARDEWITFLDQDDLLAPHALWCVARAIMERPDVRLIYTDEDKIDAGGVRSAPHFKPDWNPDLLLSYNYICHLAVYRRADVLAIGGLRDGFEGAQDYDLVLRITEQLQAQQILHLPRILYHWRVHEGSTAQAIGAKPYALAAGQRALQEALQRRGLAATVTIEDHLTYRVRYRLPEREPQVTLVIPTRNGGSLLQKCLDSVRALTDYGNYQIVIIDNGSDDPATLRLLLDYERRGQCSVVRDDRPFNYALLHNRVVPGLTSEFVLLLNDDIQVKHADWLRELVAVGMQPGVGAVGAKLLYPDDTIQHGGVLLVGGVAGHAHKHLPAYHWGYMMRARVRQTLSAVTGACLLVRKDVYVAVGGMDERLAVAFNDVDLCLAIDRAGYRIVWTPYAELYHLESATRGYDHETPQRRERLRLEAEYMMEKWGDRLRNDPAFNPNLDVMREDFALAWPPRLLPCI